MLELTVALLSFVFASFSVLATAAFLRRDIKELDTSAARLNRASETATAHLHNGIPYFTDARTASINAVVKSYVGLVGNVLTFLLFLRGTEKDVPRSSAGGLWVLTDLLGHLVRVILVTLAIGLSLVLLLPVLMLIVVCEAVHVVDHTLRLAGHQEVAQKAPPKRLSVNGVR